MGKGPLENTVEKHLFELVERRFAGMALKGDVPGRRFLDRILVLPGGITIYCECKRPQGGRYSRHQLETAERLLKLGHYVVFVNTKPGVDRLIGELKWVIDDGRSAAGLRSVSYYLSSSPQPGLYFISPADQLSLWELLPHE